MADACHAYLKDKPGATAEGVFRRHVYSGPIAKVKLDKLRRHRVREWRKRLEDAPAAVTRRKEGEPVTNVRSRATVDGRVAWVGTSNWKGGYRDNSRNVELVFRDAGMAGRIARMAATLWTSAYAKPLDATIVDKRELDAARPMAQ